MVAIIDYGVGNLFSLKSSFAAIGQEAAVTADPEELKRADKLILPGVGAFQDAADKLRRSGMDQALKEEVSRGKLLLGICLGMQMLFERSFEYGEHEGLGLLKGEIRPIAERIPVGLKIPQMGWNSLRIIRESPLLKDTREGEYVYFVHSYYPAVESKYGIARTEYMVPFYSIISRDNVAAAQFHPEKSGPVGIQIMRNFIQCEA